MGKKKNNRSGAKRELQEAMFEQFAVNTDDPLRSIGIIADHISVSQNTVPMITSINRVCQESFGVDISLFVMHLYKPFVTPLCPVFDVRKLAGWDGPLITTSAQSTLEALSTKSDRIIHYVWKPDFINIGRDIRKAFTDPRIIIVTRHDDYTDLINTEFGLSINNISMPDFDATKLIRLALT
jgi:hypothetical protein